MTETNIMINHDLLPLLPPDVVIKTEITRNAPARTSENILATKGLMKVSLSARGTNSAII